MANTLWQALTPRGETISEAIAANPDQTLVASDFDGTLADIVSDPNEAHIHPDCARAFARLAGLVGQPAIITGRGLASVRELGRLDDAPGLDRLVVKAQYGVESWDAATGKVDEPPLPPQVADAKDRVGQLLERLRAEGVDTDGVGLEDKGRALGVHTRNTSEPQAMLERLRGPVASIADELELHLEPGRFVLELRATPGTKAEALDQVWQRGRHQVAVMIGDDLADVTAFEKLSELADQHGVQVAAIASASAGEQPSVVEAADVQCEGPAGVAAWLDAVADAVEARRN